jgi:lipopolysaccharide export system protein LptA
MKRLVLPALALCLAAILRAQETPSHVTQETVITSNSGDLQGGDAENVITFKDNVKVVGTDLIMTCDFLKVTTYRKGDPKAQVGKYGAFKSLLATGHVVINQVGRVARCGRAEVLPGENRVVLMDHPEVISEGDKGKLTGYRMTLYRNQRDVVVESDPNEKVQLEMPSLKDLGFEAGAGTSPPSASK